MKRWMAAALGAALVTSSIGCSAGSEKAQPTASKDKKVVLRFATGNVGKDSMSEVVTKLLDKFKAENPEVEIVVEGAPGGFELANKIKIDVASNNTPDVFTYWRPDPNLGMDKFIEAGAIANLDDLRKDPDIKDLFDDSAWKTATVNGVVRAMPMITFYNPLLINKEILDKLNLKVPQTWDELLNVIKETKKNGYIPWGVSIIPAKSGTIERPMNYVMYRMLGYDKVNKLMAGLEPFNTPEVITALERVRELTTGYMADDASVVEDSVIYAKYINTGKVVMTLDHSSAIMKITPEVQKKFVSVDFPLIPGGVDKEKTIVKDLTTLVYASSKAYEDPIKKPYVIKFLKLFSGKEAGKMYTEIAGNPIPMRGVDIDPTKVTPLVKESSLMAEKAPGVFWMGKVMDNTQRDKVWPLLAEYWLGKYTANELAVKLDEAYKK
ncbi:ABC transporter substrate-binding protein [Paenibacillus agricola]|uniref:Extracellular solute-binding protein n=1 Tax=Paenibacillus agricola TaxID=2716264 RepID=A0ABX0JB55_9BACL|nr:extracellular solute-binding protein [Paenibacillus agricola]NHN33710.1 extracellular solute-binding protein [Paenibacillus agricola]